MPVTTQPAPFPAPFQRGLRIVAATLWLTIIVLSLVPGQDRPHTGFSGNMEHLAAYAGTAGFTALAFGAPAAVWIVLPFSGASALFELAQLYIPGRTSSPENWLASTLGALAGTLAARHAARPLIVQWLRDR